MSSYTDELFAVKRRLRKFLPRADIVDVDSDKDVGHSLRGEY